MPVPALRTKQTTNTTGTGTLTLNAASSDFISYNAAFGGSSQRVRYALSRAGAWEVGYGVFNGGSPGTLTRVSVIASSNGGSLINLGAGSTDVYFDFLPGDRAVRVVSANSTLVVADIGNLIRCTQTANITLTLPAVATVPAGMGFLVKNDGSNWSWVEIVTNGAEQLEGSSVNFPLFANEAIEIFSTGGGWRTGIRPTGKRMVARAAASGSASVDFLLPPGYPSVALAEYGFEFRNVRPQTDGAALLLRTDGDGGASYDAGASDYVFGVGYLSGAAAWSGGEFTASAISLIGDIDNSNAGHSAMGSVRLSPGAAGVRHPQMTFDVTAVGNGSPFAGQVRLAGGGRRAAAYDANAVRFLMSTGNIALGEFILFALYP